MKLKASPRARKVVVELESPESGMPPGVVPEITLKRILVPTDFSELSRKALHYAVSFAKQFNAEIHLLHVVETVPPPEPVLAYNVSFTVKLLDAAAKRLAEWQREVAPDATMQMHVRSGTAYREIVDAADETNIDLVILGTQGRTGLSHLFIGSTAERVVRHAPCPVMAVREREHDFLAEEKSSTTKAKRKLR